MNVIVMIHNADSAGVIENKFIFGPIDETSGLDSFFDKIFLCGFITELFFGSRNCFICSTAHGRLFVLPCCH
jgi:hypothetical protein